MKKVSIKVKSAVKGGRITQNHSKKSIKIKSTVKAGALSINHSAKKA